MVMFKQLKINHAAEVKKKYGLETVVHSKQWHMKTTITQRHQSSALHRCWALLLLRSASYLETD